MMRSPFFLPSGFTTQDIVNIVESNKDNRQRLEKIKQRKRQEREAANYFKHFFYIDRSQTRDRQQKTRRQIQYGFDIAAWWNEQHE